MATPSPTAYYDDFWLYASYYGEAAARVHYTHWSPPEGSIRPQGSNSSGYGNAHVPTPADEVKIEPSKDSSYANAVPKVTATPAIDPEIAAAYEEYKIEVSEYVSERMRY